MTPFSLNLLWGLLLLVVPVYMIYRYDRLSWRKPVIAFARMLVQMAVMGACLWLLFRFDTPWLCLLWLVLLVVASAFMLVSRSRLHSRVLFMPACVAMFVSVLLVSMYMIFVVLRPAASLSARWFVPVTGVLLAHVLTTNIQAVRAYFDCLRQDSEPYYTLLGNGCSRFSALAPYITRALRSLTMPAVASLSAMGLFVLPMLLSRLLLGGLQPIAAVAVFMELVIGGVVTSVLSLVLTLWLSDRKAFGPQGQLGDVFF